MSFVKRITVVGEDGVETLFKKKRKKRKSTRMMRPLEKITRRFLEAGDETSSQALRRHKRSSRKKKDGWAKDLMKNSLRSGRKGVKKLIKL